MYNNSGKKEFKPANDKAIIPLTIRQINNNLTSKSTFDNQPFYTLSIVARFVSTRSNTNFTLFTFEDGTGSIEGRINLDSGRRLPAFAENIALNEKRGDYFFVVLKPCFEETDSQKKFYIQMIKEITNYNQISKHYSDIVLSTLIRRKA